MYLKSLQIIMGNEVMQVLLESEDSVENKHKKKEYESLADLVWLPKSVYLSSCVVFEAAENIWINNYYLSELLNPSPISK